MDWLTIVQQFGVPFTILAVFAFAVWTSLRWLAAHVIEPIAKRHMAFVDALELKVIGGVERLETKVDGLGAKVEAACKWRDESCK